MRNTPRTAPLPTILLTILGACACVAERKSPFPSPSNAVVAPASTIPYTTLRGDARELYPWVGEHVAILTRTAELDAETMGTLLDALDGVYAFLHEATGREPERAYEYDGRATLAVEADTCGLGCGFLGATGIELMPEAFEETCRALNETGELSLVPTYELGRNFSFSGAALEYKGEAHTGTVSAGYARLVGLWGIEAVGRQVAPHQGAASGAEYLAALSDLADRYERDDSVSWETTLALGESVPNELDLGASNLFAALLLRVDAESGRADFPIRFLRAVGDLPPAASTQDAIDNLVVGASRAAGADLSTVFRARWRFPVSPRVEERLRGALQKDGARFRTNSSGR